MSAPLNLYSRTRQCGVLGAAAGGLGLVLCAYFLKLQRMNELALQAIFQEDLITAWSNPSPAMESAACLVQGKFRRVRPMYCSHIGPNIVEPRTWRMYMPLR